MSHLLITALRSNGVPTLDQSSFVLVEEDLLELNSKEFFCGEGHSFSLAFDESIKHLPRMFECPNCEAIALDVPFDVTEEDLRNLHTDTQSLEGVNKASYAIIANDLVGV